MKKIAKYILITFILILFIGSAQAAIHPRDMEYAYLETENFYFHLNEEGRNKYIDYVKHLDLGKVVN